MLLGLSLVGETSFAVTLLSFQKKQNCLWTEGTRNALRWMLSNEFAGILAFFDAEYKNCFIFAFIFLRQMWWLRYSFPISDAVGTSQRRVRALEWFRWISTPVLPPKQEKRLWLEWFRDLHKRRRKRGLGKTFVKQKNWKIIFYLLECLRCSELNKVPTITVEKHEIHYNYVSLFYASLSNDDLNFIGKLSRRVKSFKTLLPSPPAHLAPDGSSSEIILINFWTFSEIREESRRKNNYTARTPFFLQPNVTGDSYRQLTSTMWFISLWNDSSKIEHWINRNRINRQCQRTARSWSEAMIPVIVWVALTRSKIIRCSSISRGLYP